LNIWQVSGIVEDQALSTTGWAPYDLSGPYPPPQSTNTSDISKRVNGSRLISQNDALASLRVVSQPHNVTIIDLTDNYKYNSAAGSGITVYLIDTGANPQNSEYYLMPGTKRWMFPQNAGEPGAVLRTQSDEQNHGSCVLSKIAGPMYGVAKDVDVVIVKVPTAAMQDTVMASGMLELLAEVSEDIAKNKLQGKAVINFSGGSK
jgi:subtilisin family serine protease